MTVIHSSKLPNEPIFRKLLDNSKSIPGVIVNDPTCGVRADYLNLLRDIVVFRQQLYDALPDALFDDTGLIKPDSPYILIASPGNYEFIVASFTVLAIGGALVPIGMVLRLLDYPKYNVSNAECLQHRESCQKRPCISFKTPSRLSCWRAGRAGTA